MYIADTYNNCIRWVDSGGTIRTFAGMCISDIPFGNSIDGYLDGPVNMALFRAPWGLTFDNQVPPNLYVADAGNHLIRKINMNNLQVNTVAGMCVHNQQYPVLCQPGDFTTSIDDRLAMQTQLNTPRKVVFDDQGNYYIVDNGNQRIRRVDTAGMIHAYAGTCVPDPNGQPPNQFCLPGYGGDNGPAASAQFAYPSDIAINKIVTNNGTSAKLFVVDLVNQRVRCIDMVQATNPIMTLIGNGIPGYYGDGGLPLSSVQLNYPEAIAINLKGNLFIQDRHNLRVRQVYMQPDAQGNRTNTFVAINTFAGTGTAGFGGDLGPATAAQLYHPHGITWDNSIDTINGYFYIVDNHNQKIRKLWK